MKLKYTKLKITLYFKMIILDSILTWINGLDNKEWLMGDNEQQQHQIGIQLNTGEQNVKFTTLT